jgi:hypothetical protein
VVGVPVTGENGEFRGVLAGMFRLGATAVSAFYGDIVKLRLDESGRSFVVDAKGRAIHSPVSSRVGADLSAEAPVARFLAGGEGALRAKDTDGTDVVMGYALVPGTGWGMMSVETWSYLSAPSRGFRQTLLLLLILGVIVPAAVVTVGVRRITRDSYAQLEQTVTARTRELAVLNRVATVASGSLEIERILQDSLDQTVEATAMECGAAFRIDETSPSLEMVAQLALSPRQIAVLSDLPVASTIGVWAGHALEPRVWSVADLPEGWWGYHWWPRVERSVCSRWDLGTSACSPPKTLPCWRAWVARWGWRSTTPVFMRSRNARRPRPSEAAWPAICTTPSARRCSRPP